MGWIGMRRWYRVLAAVLWVVALGAQAGPGAVLALRVDGVVGPASADFILRGLARAEVEHAQLVVIELDTPGGLDSSMRQIIKAILASPVPVATFVAPEGARAASAGTYILYASHIAAMAPATNLGAATPVAIGISPPTPDKPARSGDKAGEEAAAPADTLAHKARNDARAYLRSLAELRGRNVEFAERAVAESASLSAEQARRDGVIDLVAVDLADLLKQLDGGSVKTLTGDVTLATAGAMVLSLEPDWRNRLLAALAHPQLALILMTLGMYGLFFEFTHPGAVVPGVVGAICLLVALFAFQLLSINWTGVALLALGAGLMVAEAFVPSFGILGIGGLAAFVLGGLFLVDPELPGYGLSLPFILGCAAVSAVVLFGLGSLAARARRRQVITGPRTLIGRAGVVTLASPEGVWAQVQGESWQVRAASPLHVGERIIVTQIEGLTLEVTPDPAAADAASHERSGSCPSTS